MRGLVLVVPWAFALGACSPIAQPQGSPAPVNACSGTSGQTCAGYGNDAGGGRGAGAVCASIGPLASCVVNDPTSACACQVNRVDNPVDPSVVLVVTVPQLAATLAGTTYAITINELYNPSAVNGCANQPYPEPTATNVCFKLAATQLAYGAYVISETQAREAGRNLGNAPGGELVGLPVAATFWPLWTPAGGSATDARLLNLPLPPVFATVGVDVATNLTFNPLTATPPGGNGSWPIEWIAALPASANALLYLTELQVLPPFNDAYPDMSYTVGIEASPPGGNTLSTNVAVAIGRLPSSNPDVIGDYAPIDQYPPPAAPPLTVQAADGAPLSAGWEVYLRDPKTRLALTSHAYLDGKTLTTRLNYFGSSTPLAPNTYELVLSPPPGASGLPELVDGDPNGVTEVYPALPPTVHVTGAVQAEDGTPVSATLLFFSDDLDDVTACTRPASTGVALPLSYDVPVGTDDQQGVTGPIGHFSIDLPQGLYGVVIEPSAASGYAKSVQGYLRVAVAEHPVCSGGSPSLDLGVLPAASPITVSGSVVTGDGRPLANASVDFTPAAAMAPSRFATPTLVSPLAEVEWPRPFTTTTGALGGFRVEVDPGQYDLTVRPQDGTQLPWLVQPGLGVGTGGVALDASPPATPASLVTVPGQILEPLVLPAPFFLSVTLEDPLGSPLEGAVVQAYAFYTPPKASPVAVAIGDAVADSNGHFSMMLTSAFASN